MGSLSSDFKKGSRGERPGQKKKHSLTEQLAVPFKEARGQVSSYVPKVEQSAALGVLGGTPARLSLGKESGGTWIQVERRGEFLQVKQGGNASKN